MNIALVTIESFIGIHQLLTLANSHLRSIIGTPSNFVTNLYLCVTMCNLCEQYWCLIPLMTFSKAASSDLLVYTITIFITLYRGPMLIRINGQTQCSKVFSAKNSNVKSIIAFHAVSCAMN